MTPPRALVVLVAVAAAAAGCGGTAGQGDSRPQFPAIEQGGERWQGLQPTLQARFDQNATNPCVRGAKTCVPLVVGEMRRRLDVLAGQCSHLAPFALMYLDVTAGVEEAQGRASGSATSPTSPTSTPSSRGTTSARSTPGARAATARSPRRGDSRSRPASAAWSAASGT